MLVHLFDAMFRMTQVRSRWRVIILAVLTLLLISIPLSAQAPSPPELDVGAALLLKAAQSTNWDDSGTPPFRLRAKFTYRGSYEKPVAGEITLLFADRNRWREEIQWFGMTSTELADGGSIWRKDVDGLRDKTNQLDEILRYSSNKLKLVEWVISSVHLRDLSGIPAHCVNLVDAFHFAREVCLDVNNGLPLRIKDDTQELNLMPAEYLPLGLKRFPRHIRYSRFTRKVLEIDIESIEMIDAPPASAFAPPPGVTPLPWCPDEKPPRPERIGGSAEYRLGWSNFIQEYVDYRVLTSSKAVLLVIDVGTDGHVKDIKAFDKRLALVPPNDALEKLRDSTFTPAICGEKVVEGEFLFELPRR
jgi:hypothetical protein